MKKEVKYQLMIMLDDGYYNPWIESYDLEKLNMIKDAFEEQGWEVEVRDCEEIQKELEEQKLRDEKEKTEIEKRIKERGYYYEPHTLNLSECCITGDLSDMDFLQIKKVYVEK